MASGGDSPLVLVTGASGYIAAHIIKLLLEEEYRVRGTVRSLQNEQKVKPLQELCPDARYPLELVEADLTNPDCWKDVVKDCTYVIHVASPFPNAPPSNEEDVVKPAVEGTKNVLQACADAGTVKRVVLTSSIVAIHGETVTEDGKVYTEGDWSNPDSPTIDAYSKSKTLAEREAWDFVKELPDDKKFELSVINPGYVLGPTVNGAISTSLEIVKRLMERSIPMVPKLNMCVCDVRDVAQGHLKAMTLPEAADHRHIISTQTVWMKDIALVLAKEFKSHGYCIPTMMAPYIALWLNSFFDKSVRWLLPRVGREFKFDNKRMKEVLEITPRELNQTIIDSAYSLLDSGLVKKSKKSKKEKTQPQTEGQQEEGQQETENKEEGEKKEESDEKEAEKEKNEEEKPKELEPEDKPEKLDTNEKVEIEAVECK
ncbi:uncharacterized protein [Centruroides vittatus]|uniref:uncharacterized protein n=1 Tax=Centruroides vittatus TaxID=120091 RepID=UPI00350F3D42